MNFTVPYAWTFCVFRYGKLNVTVVVKKERLTKGGRIMKFSKFLLDYMYEDWYMSNTVPSEMLEELPVSVLAARS